MRLLLDTHTFLWFIEDSPQLSSTAKAIIEDGTNEVFLSIASLWEMAIKVSIGKLTLRQPLQTLLPHQLSLNTIELLGITVEAVALVITLPFHHRDPFDRMLVAQALTEQMPIVGIDATLDRYGVARLW